MVLYWIILLICCFYLVLPLLLIIGGAVRRWIGRSDEVTSQTSSKSYDYAVIVTAYEDTSLVSEAVHSILECTYTNYLIYVVADKCDVSGLSFEDPRVIILVPDRILGSNVRSHMHAIGNFRRPHDVVTIIDSDNLVDPEYFAELNKYFERGFEAVQGERRPKNLDTIYARLDAARDVYYHYYDASLLFAVGSSCTLSGSGMAFLTSRYVSSFEGLDVVGAGFDKVLQYQIVAAGQRIAYASHAVVYDQKTSGSGQLVNQRARWINTWFRYVSFGARLVNLGLARLDFNRFLFGTVLLRPPLFLLLTLTCICVGAGIWMNHQMGLLLLLGSLAIFIATFLIPIVSPRTDRRILYSLVGVPKFVFFQFVSLFNARKANARSVATKHVRLD